MRYFAGGAGFAGLVLVHGLGGAAVNWRALTPLLAERFRLLVPDLPGHGGSSPLPAMPSLALVADRVAAVADRDGFTPAIFVGHSLGGLVALRIALRRPDVVAGIVLAGAAGISSVGRRARHALAITSLVKPARRLAPFRRVIARSAALRRIAFAWGVADPAGLSPAAVESFLAGPALHTDTASAAKALVVDEIRQGLDGVRCPCLVLWGAGDSQTPIADAVDYARRLRAPLRVIADCGHLLIGERPDACLAAIESFARSLPPTPGSEAR